MNDWVSFLVAWLPFLLLIGAWLHFSRYHGMQARGSSTGATLIDLYEQQVAETRKMNANLERIAGALEKREHRGAIG
jgi:ATP-dependent Zn protease